MLVEVGYNREEVIKYAEKWALSRNPAYANFDSLGGDCTNFASQCIYAGCKVMNYTPVTGWFYRSMNDRTPSWTGVKYLYEFLMRNRSTGPYGVLVDKKDIMPGDIVQLGDGSGHFYHTPVVLSVGNEILVAAHTFDALYRPLSSYIYGEIRYIHIQGARKWV